MAVRTYYGTCTTPEGTVQKEVIISDIELTEDADLETEGFQFREGDLLVVFFVNTNTVPSPSIVVNIPDTNEQISTAADSGKLIKSLDVEANMENAWAAGETVIFAYTQQSTSETYYWELVNANHASIETYGDTKLFDDDNLNSLLAGTYDGEEDIALTPNTLKKFYDLLQGQEDESPLGLKWTPYEEGEAQNLGVLSLSNDSNGVMLTYPIEAKIQEYINQNPTITHTGQLVNNGNGAGEGHETEESEPFITRIVPDDLYFSNGKGLYYGIPNTDPESQETTAYPRIILNDNENKISIGDGNDNSLAGIVLNKQTKVIGNLDVNGVISTTKSYGPEDTEHLSPLPTSNTRITTDGIIEEQNTPLNQRYGPLYKVLSKIDTNIPLIGKNRSASRDGSPHLRLMIHETGWKAIGVVGYNVSWDQKVNSGGAAGDQAFALLWENHCVRINNIDYVNFAIRNLRDSDIKVNITFWILYQKEGIS